MMMNLNSNFVKDLILIKDQNGDAVDVISERNANSFRIIRTEGSTYLIDLEKKAIGKVDENTSTSGASITLKKWHLLPEGKPFVRFLRIDNNGMLIPGERSEIRLANGPKKGECFKTPPVKACFLASKLFANVG